MRKIKISVLIILSLFFLSSCSKGFSMEEVRAFMEEEYPSVGYEIISEEIKDLERPEHYVRCQMKDFPNLEFDILISSSYQLFSYVESLHTNLDYKIVDFYLEDYPGGNSNLLLQRGELFLGLPVLTYQYKNKGEIGQGIEELKNLHTYLLSVFPDLKSHLALSYKYDISQDLLGSNSKRTQVSTPAGKNPDYNYLESEAEKAYLLYSLSYQVNLDDLDLADVKSLISSGEKPQNYGFTIFKEDEFLYWEDLLKHPYGKKLSVGTFYEILKRIGYPDLEGNSQSFKVIGEDGFSYEFSYDFVRDGLAYYIKDGEKIDFGSHYGFLLDEDLVKDISGYQIVEGWHTKESYSEVLETDKAYEEDTQEKE